MTTELQIIGFKTFDNFVNLHKNLQSSHYYTEPVYFSKKS